VGTDHGARLQPGELQAALSGSVLHAWLLPGCCENLSVRLATQIRSRQGMEG